MKVTFSLPTTTQGIALANALGLAVSIFLWYTVLTTNVIGCFTGGCGTVLFSRYAKILGVPIAAWGVAYYGVNLLITAVRLLDDRPVLKLINWAISFFGIFASGYYFYLELYKINAICSWCKVSTVATIVLAILVIIEIRKAGGLRSVYKQVILTAKG